MYRLTGRLEQSQLADLFRAERDGSDSVVIKLFHLKTSDAAYARVIGDVSRQLQPVPHEGIARVLDVGMVDGHLAIVRQDSGKYTLGLALQRLNMPSAFSWTKTPSPFVHSAQSPMPTLFAREQRM